MSKENKAKGNMNTEGGKKQQKSGGMGEGSKLNSAL